MIEGINTILVTTAAIAAQINNEYFIFGSRIGPAPLREVLIVVGSECVKGGEKLGQQGGAKLGQKKC